MQVYYGIPSIYGRKVLAVLEEKNLDYQIKQMSFKTQDNLKEDYLKLNPNGEIPTLVDDDVIIYESTAIIEYLNDEYPEPPLMPEESAKRAQVRMIEDYCDLHAYKPVVDCFIKKYVKKEELIDEDFAPIKENLARLEKYLGTKQFIAGNFSLADCAVMPIIASLDGYGVTDKLVTSKEMKGYFQRLRTRPGFKGASLFSFEPATQNA